MRFTFKNLGAIAETELDLKPLTVIIGPNNSNKTYVAYCMYGYLKFLRQARVIDGVSTPAFIDSAYEFSINEDLATNLSRRCDKLAAYFRDGLTEFFQDTSERVFKEAHISTCVDLASLRSAVARLPEQMTIEGVPLTYQYSNGVVRVRLREALDEPGSEVGQRISQAWGRGLLGEIAYRGLLNGAIFPKPFALPAERNALIIAYKILATRRYRLLRDSARRQARRDADRQSALFREQGDLRYPQPIEDFLDFLTDAELAVSNNRAVQETVLSLFNEDDDDFIEAGSAGESRFSELASYVEEFMQGGQSTRYVQTVLGGKELALQINPTLGIDLYNASSSIKQLAPLLLYLRHRAKSNDLLIIDEPEMNLHPEAQAKLVEILSILVKHGIWVLLTTHSPYIMAHVNNLAEDGELDLNVRAKRAESLYLKNPDAFVPIDNISAYEMRDHKLVSLKDPDYGIRWDTLSDVAVDLQQMYFKIHSTEG